ncbi:MAG TPA: 50S ribosomal protein L25/general stress protein Ctc [Burkholderiales bacterium]|nr:50S ribosomal protein L25/general stress protein Ctc [Burkholderiales bacterium]
MEVTAFPRTTQGTGASRRLRGSGRAPGIIYGANKPAANVELDQNALLRHLKMEAFHASILDMTVDGNKERVLLRDFQMHPWKPIVLHVDFQRVDPNKKIHMRVPLHFTNEDVSEGVKTQGGVVTHAMTDIEIQCLPDHLPEYIAVDLKSMKLNDIYHVNDLTMPAGVEPTAKLKGDNPAVVSMHVPRVAAAEEEAATPVTEITGQAPAEAAAAAAAEGEQKGKAK